MHVLLQDQRGRFIAAAACARDSLRVLGRCGPASRFVRLARRTPGINVRVRRRTAHSARAHYACMRACMPNDRLAIAIARASCEPTDAMRVMHASP